MSQTFTYCLRTGSCVDGNRGFCTIYGEDKYERNGSMVMMEEPVQISVVPQSSRRGAGGKNYYITSTVALIRISFQRHL